RARDGGTMGCGVMGCSSVDGVWCMAHGCDVKARGAVRRECSAMVVPCAATKAGGVEDGMGLLQGTVYAQGELEGRRLSRTVVAGTHSFSQRLRIVNADTAANSFWFASGDAPSGEGEPEARQSTEPWVLPAPAQGELAAAGTGSVSSQVEVWLDFPTVILEAGRRETTLHVMRAAEGGEALLEHVLQVVMTVVPAGISNQSVAVQFGADTDQRLVVGDTAYLGVYPKDCYGNAAVLDTAGNPIKATSSQFVVEVFQLMPEPALAAASSEDLTFDAEKRRFEGAVRGITQAGHYQVFVRLAGDAAPPADTGAAARWTWLHEVDLRGSPLNYTFESVQCNTSAHLVVSEAGTACVCAAGFMPQGSAQQCIPCLRGLFKDWSERTCVPCPPRSTTAAPGAASGTACVCDVGYYHDQVDDKEEWDKKDKASGEWLRDLVCVQCPAGTYQELTNATGEASCTRCPAGSSAPARSASPAACTGCASGLVAPVAGSSECTACGALSSTVGDDRTACVCRDGYYDQGYYEAARAAREGSEESYTQENSEHSAASPAEKQCTPCVTGGECTLGRIVAQPGFWRADIGRTKLYRCRHSLCLGEPEATPSSDAGNSTAGASAMADIERTTRSVVVCREGHGGVLCQACSEGYELRGRTCELCGDTRVYVAVGAVITCAAVLGALLARPLFSERERRLLVRVRRRLKRSRWVDWDFVERQAQGHLFLQLARQDVAHAIGMQNNMRLTTVLQGLSRLEMQDRSSREWLAFDSVVDLLGRYLKIAVSYLQVLGTFDEVYDISWGADLHSVFSWARMSNLELFFFPSLGCMYPAGGFVAELYVYMAAPVAFALAVAVYFLLARRWCLRDTPNPARDLRLFNLKSTCIRLVLVVLYLVYPALCGKVLASFNCIEVHGEHVLRADVEYACYNASHRATMALASLGVVLYPFGIPLIFLLLMIRYRVPELAQYKRQAALMQQVLFHSEVGASVPGAAELVDAIPELDSETVLAYIDLTMLRHVARIVRALRDGGSVAAEAPPSASSEVLAACGEAEGSRGGGAPDLCAATAEATGWSAAEEVALRRALRLETLEEQREREALLQEVTVWAASDAGEQVLGTPATSTWLEYPMDRLHAESVRTAETAEGWSERMVAEDDLSPFQEAEAVACAHVGFIFSMYRVELWWYEIFDLARKLALTGLVALLNESSFIKVAISFFLCNVALFAHLSFSPLTDTNINYLAAVALLELMGTLFLGLLLEIGNISEEEREGSIFRVAVFVLTGLIFLFPVIVGAKSVIPWVKEQLSARRARRATKRNLVTALSLQSSSSNASPSLQWSLSLNRSISFGRTRSSSGHSSGVPPNHEDQSDPLLQDGAAQSAHGSDAQTCIWESNASFAESVMSGCEPEEQGKHRRMRSNQKDEERALRTSPLVPRKKITRIRSEPLEFDLGPLEAEEDNEEATSSLLVARHRSHR
ncbi:hypothetical protein CYMTET_29196, partial [Cymbomonas tetramitiformis]